MTNIEEQEHPKNEPDEQLEGTEEERQAILDETLTMIEWDPDFYKP
jgi:hypothetical protein